jgi:hypothetical protein
MTGERLRGGCFFRLRDGEQEMLGRHVLVFEVVGGLERAVEDFAQRVGDLRFSGRAANLREF